MRRKIDPKSYFISLIGVVLIADIAILLDIPVLRQVFGFLSFTIIPGLLILHIFKLHEASLLKKFLLSVGLSISFLMVGGLLINVVLSAAGYSTPLSTTSLVISFSLILLVLCFVAYWRNRGRLLPSSLPRLRMSTSKSLLSLMLFPILFPLLSVLGTQLMNTEGNNVILMAMLFLIPAYVVALVCLRKRVHPATYPLALGMIGIALLLMQGLTSNYFLGYDIYGEYHIYQMVSNNLDWSTAPLQNGLTASLSISILPTVYKSIMGLSDLTVPKVIYPLIVSMTPLICYIMFKRYISPIYAFLASVFFMAQIPFMYILGQHMRIEIALFFLALVLMVLFDDEIVVLKKSTLFLIFMATVVVSYYVTPVILFVLLLVPWLVSKLMKNRLKSKSAVSGAMVGLCLVIIFLWWSQITGSIFPRYVIFVRNTFTNLGILFTSELQLPETQQVQSFLSGPLADKITIIVQFFSFLLVAIGTISIGIKYKNRRFNPSYIIMMVAALIMLGAILIMPYMLKGYTGTRLYLQLFIVLAPAFVIGGETIARFIHSRLTLLVITLVLVSQFFSASFLIQQVSGIPYSEVLNTTGVRHGAYYVYDTEVDAARWLRQHTDGDLEVYMDYTPYPHLGGIFMLAGFEPEREIKVSSSFFKNNKPIEEGYIFLRRVNVAEGLVYDYTTFREPLKIADYSHLFTGKAKIYANGSAEIYR